MGALDPRHRLPLAEVDVAQLHQGYLVAAPEVEVALVAPSEWRVEPEVLRFGAAPGVQTRRSFAIQAPRGWQPKLPRFAVAADVLCDGKYLGQITEAVVEITT